MEQVKERVSYWCDDTNEHKVEGKEIGVAILDTGIALHPDFDKRILCFRDFVNDQEMFYDDNGHGTHIAGIIGGSGKLSGGKYAGIAPKCNLIPLKVLDKRGNGEIDHVIQGSKWILKNAKKYHIRIVNISVGTLPDTNRIEEEKLLTAVEEMWDEGLVVVVAAGNYGPKGQSITVPGVSKKVITVGASDDKIELFTIKGRLKDYSGRGPTKECVMKPDLVAPGSKIYSCNSRYGKKGREYSCKSGTSMATPVVSGAIALLLSKYPEMTNVEVKLRLRQTCVDLGQCKNQQGWGELCIKKLLSIQN
ncbi:S8 family peptidase [Faecalimonas sp.]